MTLKTFLQRLKDGDKNTNPVVDQQLDKWSLEESLEEYRLKKYSTEIPQFGGVRD